MIVQPWKAGVVQGTEKFSDEQVQTHTRRVAAAGNLRALAADYALFTLGIVECASWQLEGFSAWGRYFQEKNLSLTPVAFHLDKPLFDGFKQLGFPLFDCKLWGLDHVQGADFLAWLGTVSLLNRSAKTLYRIRTGTVTVVDPLDGVSAVDVTTVCLDTSLGCVYIRDRTPIALPTVVMSEQVMPDTLQLRDALLADEPRPFT